MAAAGYGYRFCPLCGTMMDLPGIGSTISCPLCKHQNQIKYTDDLEVVTYITPGDLLVRHGVEPLVPLAIDEGTGVAEGEAFRERAKVNEDCPKCGNKELEYYTMQLRSADEGQTIFYECPKCHYKYKLNS